VGLHVLEAAAKSPTQLETLLIGKLHSTIMENLSWPSVSKFRLSALSELEGQLDSQRNQTENGHSPLSVII
jgi:hypothetical protein